MAGDWIKMRTDLHTHPKVVRIASALDADRLRVIGALHASWCLFDVHSVDGVLDGYSPKTLDDMIGFPGFANAMIAVGWLECADSSLCMPRFFEHNGQSAKRRAQEADRKRNARKSSADNADKKRTREEKRREDLKDKPPISGDDENLSDEPKEENTGPPAGQKQPGPVAPSYLDGVDIPIGKFTLYDGWMPSPDFQQRAALWGRAISGPSPGYTQQELAAFTSYWVAEGKVFNHVQWEQKFADSVLYERRQQSIRQPIGASHAEKSNAGESQTVRDIRAARAAWEREQQGVDAVGNHGGNIFKSVDEQERADANGSLDGASWRPE
ncbi:DnaT-like ssDNA-binding domain-containing protein [Pectobacterium brasiliense]|uniref:DnaT-like ssDNA-binding domain-containing protein n=1 Tax=Pectobacterium brasiliense TaxID=180957 RepID=A0AAW9HH80_9GAMM|nr:DnaT-like ssDNA-binding domain-containing protein [Pectobacterium brasiliense]MDY4380373.1 DnaT-like ssDNA-binding domain-containing protein [Pectobacterium brasiliense]